MSLRSTVLDQLDREMLSHVESNFEAYIAIIMLLAYTAIIFYDIISRFTTGKLINGNLQIVEGMFTWAVWLSAAFAVRRRAHLRFTLIRERMSQRTSYLIYIVEWILWIGIVGVILRFSLPLLMSRIAQGAEVASTGIPVYLFTLAIPVGTALMIIRVLQQAVIITQEYRSGEDITPDPSLL